MEKLTHKIVLVVPLSSLSDALDKVSHIAEVEFWVTKLPTTNCRCTTEEHPHS